MTDDDRKVIHGSGNVFRDLGLADPEVRQAKAILAASIAKALDAQHLTVRAAHELTGVPAADFSRIRRANLDRFTVDRLMRIAGLISPNSEFLIDIREREKPAKGEVRRDTHPA